MKTDLFDFHLPEDRIALRPLWPRESAKLLEVSPKGDMSDYHIGDLADRLRPGDVLVLNETLVIPAALSAMRPARDQIQSIDVNVSLNLLKRQDKTAHLGTLDGVTAQDMTIWQTFVKPSKRLKIGDPLILDDVLQARIIHKYGDGRADIAFNMAEDDFLSHLHHIGPVSYTHLTLPTTPYV